MIDVLFRPVDRWFSIFSCGVLHRLGCMLSVSTRLCILLAVVGSVGLVVWLLGCDLGCVGVNLLSKPRIGRFLGDGLGCCFIPSPLPLFHLVGEEGRLSMILEASKEEIDFNDRITMRRSSSLREVPHFQVLPQSK